MAQGAISYRCTGCGRTGEGWLRNDLNPPMNPTHCPACNRWFGPEDVTLSQSLRNQMRAENTPEARERCRAALQRLIDSVPEKYR
jgi:hypothetical protein